MVADPMNISKEKFFKMYFMKLDIYMLVLIILEAYIPKSWQVHQLLWPDREKIFFSRVSIGPTDEEEGLYTFRRLKPYTFRMQSNL